MPSLRFGPFVLDVANARLMRDGEQVALQPKALDLLRTLAERPKVLVAHAELRRIVWPDVHVGDNALTQMVRRIRKTLGDEEVPYRYIEAVSKRGYRFVAEVTVDASGSPNPPVSGLVGREELVSRLQSLVAQSGVVVLVGPGGIGKTRLARHLAGLGGATFVDVSQVLDDTALVLTVAAALGLPHVGRDVQEAADRVGRRLADRADLLVLDNLEQVAEAAARRITAWHLAAPRARILGTSRRTLSGLTAVEVGALDPADASQLFLHRIQSQLPAEEKPALHSLVVRLEGNPLAIELAAARYPLLAPRELLDRLDQRFELSWRGGGRNETLEEVVGWSWRLLAEPERTALAAVSVFVGPFSAAEAETVVGGGSFDALQALTEHHLVQAGPGERRLFLSEPVRAFARARLAEHADREGFERRWAALVLARAEPSVVAWKARADGEHIEALAALAGPLLAVATRLVAIDPDTAARAALTYVRVLIERGPFDLAFRLCAQAAAAPDADVAARAARRLLIVAAWTLQTEEALVIADEVLLRAKGVERLRLRVRRAYAAVARGSWEASALELDGLRTEALAADDRRTWLEATTLLAEVLESDRRAAAEPMVREALGWCRTPATDIRRRVLLVFLANYLKNAGRYEEALPLYEEAMALAERHGGGPRAIKHRINVGNLHVAWGRFAEADAVYRAALTQAVAVGDRELEMLAVGNQAVSAVYQRDLARATDDFRRVLATAQAVGHVRYAVWSLYNLGAITRLSGHLETAIPLLQSCLDLAHEHQLGRYERLSALELACALADLERAPEAEAVLAHLLPATDDERARLAIAQGHVALARGQDDEARAKLTFARTLAPRLPEVAVVVAFFETRLSSRSATTG